ncbi:hypothetical protein HPB51_006925 [Rhipicephalus microplus]|uniref:Uncharacterized protein n=1 Tax=Rhipicephalus microplus TaxID=6941 RepID=A0A9J6EYX2_RHIMP|nr:hypothetical protein HPB51_006925 [Rhipicephalus microplus]
MSAHSGALLLSSRLGRSAHLNIQRTFRFKRQISQKQPGFFSENKPLKDTASVVATVPQAPDAAHYEAPAAQSALQTTETKKPFLSAPQEPALPHNFVVQQPRQHYDSDPTIDGPHREVLPIATVVFVNLDLRTFKWTSMPGQAVFVFPSPQDIDPNWIRLVTRNSDPHTIIAYLLGLIERVGNADFQRILNAAAKEGLKLEQVRLSRRDIRLDLNGLLTDSEPAPTKDDFHVLLAVLLCILSGPRSIDMNRRWYHTHVKGLVEIFPEVSGEVTVPHWHEAQEDAICAFGDRWPCTRAAIRSIILKGTFTTTIPAISDLSEEFVESSSSLDSKVSCIVFVCDAVFSKLSDGRF